MGFLARCLLQCQEISVLF
uniref:Uncharacterized protein n=1 Tax=Arundo donax TaxID=35708 RepID=A0A0A9A5G0_ARUDO